MLLLQVDEANEAALRSRNDLLCKLAHLCKKQGSFHLATKKYTQVHAHSVLTLAHAHTPACTVSVVAHTRPARMTLHQLPDRRNLVFANTRPGSVDPRLPCNTTQHVTFPPCCCVVPRARFAF